MANTVKLTIKVDDNGSLSVVAKEAKKATDATDKLGRSTDKLGKSRGKFNKGEKGVAGATSNSTKAFSKMRNEMGGGSSGLVGAYATLAANVFALTAAFGILQRSSQIDELTASLQFLGNAAGTNLNIVVDELKNVTDAALSTEQALRAASVGTSAGFSTAEIVKLTEVAKGASLALGRDLGDAQDRLIRGVAKLEPEILDELGILVRLDDASEKYAVSLGKTVQQLTVAEKQQAFFNATAEQGAKKYGALAAEFETNPYNQLSASLSNLLKEFVTIINKGLVPFVKFLSESQGALLAFSGLFLSTISSTILPAMTALGQKMASNSALTSEFAQANLKGLQSVSKGTTVYSKFVAGVQDGSKSISDYKEGLTSLDKTISMHRGGLAGMEKDHTTETAKLHEKRAALALARKERLQLIQAVRLHQIASAKMTAAHALETISTGGLIAGFKALGTSMSQYKASLVVAGAQSGGMTAVLNGLKVAGFSASLAIRGLGAAFFAMLGPISLFITVGMLAYDFIKNKFFAPDAVEAGSKALTETLENITNIQKQFTESAATGSNRVIEGIVAVNGVISQNLGLIKERSAAINNSAKAEQAAAVAAKKAADAKVASARATIAAMPKGRRNSGNNEFREARDAIVEGERAAESATKTIISTLKTASSVSDETRASLGTLVTQLKSGQLSEYAPGLISELETLKTSFRESGELGVQKFNETLEALKKESEDATAFINNLPGALQNFRKESNKLSGKSSTPFDSLLSGAIAVQAELNNLNKVSGKTRKALLDNLSAIVGDDLAESFGENKDGAAAAVNTYVEKLQAAVDVLATLKTRLKANSTLQRGLAEGAKNSVTAFQALVLAQKAGFDIQQEGINAETTALAARNDIDAKTRENLKANIENKQAALDIDMRSVDAGIVAAKTDQIRAKNKQQILNIDKKALAVVKDAQRLSEDLAVVQTKLANAKSRADGSTALTPQQELKIAQDQMAVREAAIKREYDLKVSQIGLEAQMARISFDLIEAQLLASETMTGGMQERLDLARATIDTVKKGQEDNAKDQKTLDEKNLALDIVNKTNSAKSISGARGASTSETVTNLFKKEAVQDKDGKDTGDTASIADLATTGQEKIAVLKAGVTQMMDEVAKLGPEGQVVAAVAQGSFAIAEGFTKAFDSSAKGMEKSAAIAQAVGDSIGAVNSMVQAGISATIAKIDEEINAEKKRDGKSSQSVAKIAAMEKKKEAQKKKAFEANKKMLMAQTVANTAAGIMGAVGKDPTALGIAMAVLIGAMGAAQLAVIAGTSYQGGGAGAAPPGTPSQITMGERSNKSDLATSRSARGELAYARGEDGVGNMANFKPAFSGYKNRAEGGKAGFVVGEQGPELFVPEMPGRIVPNDDIGAGGLGNVQFNINTVDASGVEDLLVAQRGNIIGMIRQAANSYGQDFVEDVDTSTFTQSAGGVSKY